MSTSLDAKLTSRLIGVHGGTSSSVWHLEISYSSSILQPPDLCVGLLGLAASDVIVVTLRTRLQSGSNCVGASDRFSMADTNCRLWSRPPDRAGWSQ
jgi:hypothetical protein